MVSKWLSALLFLFICSFYGTILFAQSFVQAQQITIEEAAAQSIILSIQYGKPGSGGRLQDFPLKSGEIAFVQTGLQVSPATTPSIQETVENAAYKAELAKISVDIATKISEIQAKQREIDTELFIAQRPPLQNERRYMEEELNTLKERRTQIEAEKTAKEALKPPPPPVKPPVVAQGFTVKPTIIGNKVVLEVKGQGIEANVEAPINKWISLFSNEKTGEEIWARVSLVE